VRLRKLGHCCLLVEEGDSRLLIDPGRFSAGVHQVKGLTGILISHIHKDHLDIGRLQALLCGNPDAQVVCDVASGAALAGSGVKAQVVQAGHEVDLGMPVRVYGHEHAVIHPDLPVVPNVGYLLADRFFYAGDAFTVPDRTVEVLAVPLTGPWMKISEALDWLRIVRPRIAVPVRDYDHVFAELDYHVLERLSPTGTTVLALNSECPAEFLRGATAAGEGLRAHYLDGGRRVRLGSSTSSTRARTVSAVGARPGTMERKTR
jgi:L-ascorbate metabolism protein UlaG (beta-lactamase superfamily)